MPRSPSRSQRTGKQGAAKVLVWDLDNTLWDGTLLEGDDVRPRAGAVQLLETLDRRGILHSIASKNDRDHALERLHALGLDHYFLYPQIGWSAKSVGIARIAESINIGLDAVAFIDDQPFELDEVKHAHPEVLTLRADQLADLESRPEFLPRFITDESAIRRRMYQADIERNGAHEEFAGPDEAFLASLGMRFVISTAREEDLKRAEELTVRTNQLNSTGVTYSYDELEAIRHEDDKQLLVAELTDKYGTYGKIGLVLLQTGAEFWTLELLLMSCRVMSRGVGTIMLSYLMEEAREAGVRLRARLKKTDRNRMMRVTYRFAGFKEVASEGDVSILESDLGSIQPFPDYVDIALPDRLVGALS